MMRMTSGSTTGGIGNLMLEQFNRDKAASGGKDTGIGKLLLDRYNTNKAPNEATAIEKLLQDKYEKSKANAAATYSTYNAAGIRKNFGGGRLFR